ncbi:Recombination endonuclease VII [uncultured Caudovirales phage]|uniref:Recombination endonuclease VII n=1 Tax=uncultured Caudovirales phage TaxID=2100421 RepID=A0A6J5PH37_9CAUD|nr:Recombination endonuclease VII [uncultured Caudovirales phage]CAB4168465.1 Recombination endonuclease VII [uncultured Caudovirales phage]CAB4196468.1 Recombination endonuclease VII [uncultured Caudovirales phage]CAB4205307.1 Recombination endonuclease VII [uncultured Caudovirales phage]
MATSGTYSWSMESEKVCSVCKLTKSLDQFYTNNAVKDKKSSRCKECDSAKCKRWVSQNKEKRAESSKKWQSINKESQTKKKREWCAVNKDKVRAHWLKKGYGMTPDDYNALFEQQDGRCLGCMTHQSELSKPLFVDHKHSTGAIRGLLCQSCNTALGCAKDDPIILGYLIDYLKGTK